MNITFSRLVSFYLIHPLFNTVFMINIFLLDNSNTYPFYVEISDLQFLLVSFSVLFSILSILGLCILQNQLKPFLKFIFWLNMSAACLFFASLGFSLLVKSISPEIANIPWSYLNGWSLLISVLAIMVVSNVWFAFSLIAATLSHCINTIRSNFNK